MLDLACPLLAMKPVNSLMQCSPRYDEKWGLKGLVHKTVFGVADFYIP